MGLYRVYLDGRLITEQHNVITDAGKKAILRYLAGENASWGAALAIGAGRTLAAATDTRLEFEIGRAEVDVSVSDLYNVSIKKKATFSNEVVGYIKELGLYTAITNTTTDNVDKMLTTFDSLKEPWTLTGATSVQAVRVGENSLQVTSGQVALLDEFYSDLSVYQGTDQFSLFVYSSDLSQVEVRFEVDATNYFGYTIPSGGSYRVISWNKNSMSVNGNPLWDSLTKIRFIGVAGTPQLEGLRINDTDPYENYALVSRAIVPAGQEEFKYAEQELEVEYEQTFANLT